MQHFYTVNLTDSFRIIRENGSDNFHRFIKFLLKLNVHPVELWILWPDSFTILGMSGTSGGGATMTFLVPPSI